MADRLADLLVADPRRPRRNPRRKRRRTPSPIAGLCGRCRRHAAAAAGSPQNQIDRRATPPAGSAGRGSRFHDPLHGSRTASRGVKGMRRIQVRGCGKNHLPGALTGCAATDAARAAKALMKHRYQQPADQHQRHARRDDGRGKGESRRRQRGRTRWQSHRSLRLEVRGPLEVDRSVAPAPGSGTGDPHPGHTTFCCRDAS